MGAISAKYASPLLRWALLLEDHPQATYRYDLVRGANLPDGHAIPAQFGGDKDFCLATVKFPAGSGMEDAYGYKGVDVGVNGSGSSTSPVKTAEQWQQLCTKALGRALKRCGYPDDMDELKSIIAWRKRLAELSAIDGGAGQPAIGPGGTEGDPVDRALTAAATEDHPDTAAVVAVEPDEPEDGIVDADSEELVVEPEPVGLRVPPPVPPGDSPDVPGDVPEDDMEPPTDELLAAVRDMMNKTSDANVQQTLRAWARSMGLVAGSPKTRGEARAVLVRGETLLRTGE